jgi:hypothetical protein
VVQHSLLQQTQPAQQPKALQKIIGKEYCDYEQTSWQYFLHIYMCEVKYLETEQKKGALRAPKRSW